MAVMTYIDAINAALSEEMERDPNVFIIGEDVGKMGGAFKATKGLLEKFGSERVIDSPLAEGAIISSSIGAAMAGMRPVPEIQFVDFITPGMDALTQQAAKLRYRSAGTQTCPQEGKVVGRFKATGVRPKVCERLKACGIHLPGDMFEGVTEIR